MRSRSSLAVAVLGSLAAWPVAAQEFYRCSSPEGRVTYQQAPCPKTDEQRKVDATPANTDFDLSKRDEVLRKGEEAGRRLEERAAREAEEARRRREAREREERLEREAQEREASREAAVLYWWPANRPLPRPPPPAPPPRPLPQGGKK